MIGHWIYLYDNYIHKTVHIIIRWTKLHLTIASCWLISVFPVCISIYQRTILISIELQRSMNLVSCSLFFLIISCTYTVFRIKSLCADHFSFDLFVRIMFGLHGDWYISFGCVYRRMKKKTKDTHNKLCLFILVNVVNPQLPQVYKFFLLLNLFAVQSLNHKAMCCSLNFDVKLCLSTKDISNLYNFDRLEGNCHLEKKLFL